MKKFLSLVLVALMVIPFGIFTATGVSAADEVIYVKDGATGNGSSADNALGSFDDGIKAAAAKSGNVTVKFVGEVSLDMTSDDYNETTHTNTITWTGNDANSKLVVNSNTKYYRMGGDLVIKDLYIEIANQNYLFLVTNLYDITVDEGVTIKNADEANKSYTAKIYGIVAQDTKPDPIAAAKPANCWNEAKGMYVANPTITLKSGSFDQVVGFMANHNLTPMTIDGAEQKMNLDGTVTINISGDTYVNKLYIVCNSFNTATKGVVNLNGGVIGSYFGASDRPYAGGNSRTMSAWGMSGVTESLTFNIGKDFSVAAQTQLTGMKSNAFYGISGTTASPLGYKEALSEANLGEYVLKIDDSIYDAVMASTIINKDSFEKFYKGDKEVTGDAPNTDAPTTDAPTTNAPTTNAPTTDAPTTNAPTTNAPTTSAPVTDAATTTAPSTTSPATDAQTSTSTQKADDTTAAPDDKAEEGFPVWIIIVIVAVIAVAGVAVVIIVKKKKAE